MRKYLFLILALLLVSGIAGAANIPTAVDGKNYPIVWTESVYNGSGSTIATGSAVVWDFDTSDSDVSTSYDDMCNWVTTTTTASDPWTAGVTPIDNAILNGERGTIIIRGPAVVNKGGSTVTFTVNDHVGTTTTAGVVAEISAVTNDGAILGTCIKDSAVGVATIYTYNSIIYVQPTPFFDD